MAGSEAIGTTTAGSEAGIEAGSTGTTTIDSALAPLAGTAV